MSLTAGNDDFAAMARFELAQLYDRTGQADQAVKLYQQLIAKPAVLVPKASGDARSCRTLQLQAILPKPASFTPRSNPSIPIPPWPSKPTRDSLSCPAKSECLQ